MQRNQMRRAWVIRAIATGVVSLVVMSAVAAYNGAKANDEAKCPGVELDPVAHRSIRAEVEALLNDPSLIYEGDSITVYEKPWIDIGVGTVTAYCPCVNCCGKWAGGPTASGAMPNQGVTVAVDPSVIPIGSEVMIEGDDTIYIAQDTGGHIKGARIDLFFDSHLSAREYGVQYHTIYWRNAE